MRSYSFISLALILSIQLVSSQDIIGNWSNPTTFYDSDSYCCVPTSITIETMEGTNNLKAIYKFPSIFQQGYSSKCGLLFGGNVNGQGTATLYRDASTGQYFIQSIERVGAYSTLTRNYIFNSGGSGTLYVTGSAISSSTTCYFAMSSGGFSFGVVIGLIFLILVVVGIVAFKNYQKKQQAAIMAQNFARNDSNIYQPNPAYIAPQQYTYAPSYYVVQPQTGFVAQQPQAQVGFVAQPGQPQMAMNLNVNADGHTFGPVNGAVPINYS